MHVAGVRGFEDAFNDLVQDISVSYFVSVGIESSTSTQLKRYPHN